MTRQRLQLLGLGAVLLGFALIGVGKPLHPIIAQYGYTVVVVLSGGTMFAGLMYAINRRVDAAAWWQPSDTELGYRVSVPGDEFADVRKRELRERLRQRVIVSLMNDFDCSRSDATTRIENGTWTDNRLAAAYLGPDDVSTSLTAWLVGVLRGEHTEQRAVRQTVAALRELRRRHD